MTIDRGILDRIRARGEEVLTQVSAGLTSSPRFARAVEGAMRGKEKLEQGVGRALKQINVPTRSELKRALARIESLEREVAELKAKAKAKARPAARRRPAARKPRPKPTPVR
jgi:poly(hydroxyalkanoate) synthase III subunit E